MTGPVTGVDLLRAVAAERGLPFDDALLADVAAFEEAMQADLARIRAIPLELVPDAVTPLDAVAWIERGGKGSPFVRGAGA